MIEIIPYNDKYRDAFRQLNLEWLDRYRLTESHDLHILNNPTETILAAGGFIWLAKAGEEIVGSVALIRQEVGIFELAKMAVTPAWQQKGIAKRLLETSINKAKENGVKKITLFSNHQLTAALKLYEKFGFTHVEVINSPFKTADIKMELVL